MLISLQTIGFKLEFQTNDATTASQYVLVSLSQKGQDGICSCCCYRYTFDTFEYKLKVNVRNNSFVIGGSSSVRLTSGYYRSNRYHPFTASQKHRQYQYGILDKNISCVRNNIAVYLRIIQDIRRICQIKQCSNFGKIHVICLSLFKQL